MCRHGNPVVSACLREDSRLLGRSEHPRLRHVRVYQFRAQSCDAQPECLTSCWLQLPSHLARQVPLSVHLLPPRAMQLEELPQWGGEVGLLVEEFEASEMQLEMAPPVVVSIPEEGGAFELQLEEAPATAPRHQPSPPVVTSTPRKARKARSVDQWQTPPKRTRTRTSAGSAGSVQLQLASDLVARMDALLQLCTSFFLELFAGSAGLCAAVGAAGHPSLGLDIKEGFDLCDAQLQAVLMAALRAKKVWGVWLGTECSSWSRARRGRSEGGGMPRALRSDVHLWGLPGLTPSEQRRVEQGNAMAQFTVSVIRLCIELQIPVGLENPLCSRLWLLPELDQLSSLPCAQRVNLHMCQFGAPWLKPTQIRLWNCGPADAARRQCACRRQRSTSGTSLCSATGAPHVLLSGKTTSQGLRGFKTSAASVYPVQFCNTIADIMMRARVAQG